MSEIAYNSPLRSVRHRVSFYATAGQTGYQYNLGGHRLRVHHRRAIAKPARESIDQDIHIREDHSKLFSRRVALLIRGWRRFFFVSFSFWSRSIAARPRSAK